MSDMAANSSASRARRTLASSGRVWAASVVLLTLLSLGLTWEVVRLRTSAAAVPPEFLEAPPLPVNTQVVQSGSAIEQVRSYTGMVRARRRSNLGFELSGMLLEVRVDEGQKVAENDVLAVLDTRTLESQRKAIQAQIRQAKAVLDELEYGPREEQKQAAKAEMDAAEAEYRVANNNWKRRHRLRETGAIPEEELDQAEFRMQTLKARWAAATQVYQELDSGTRQEKKAAQRATVAQLEASLEEVDVAIEKSTLRAPFDAVISERFVDPGSIAQPSVPIVRLIEDEHLEAWVGLPVEASVGLELGQTQPVMIDEQSYSCEVAAIIAELDPATRTRSVVLNLPREASGSVVSGQLCVLPLNSRIMRDDLVLVPRSALAKGVRGLWSVMVVESEAPDTFRARKIDVDVERTTQEGALVKGDLQAGTLIVRDGVHRITSGQQVRPLDPQSESEAAK